MLWFTRCLATTKNKPFKSQFCMYTRISDLNIVINGSADVLAPKVARNYNDVIMSAMASQSPASRLFTLPFIQGADQRKHQSSASLAFVRGIHRWPVNSPHKRPVKRKIFSFDDGIMATAGVIMTTQSQTLNTFHSQYEYHPYLTDINAVHFQAMSLVFTR